MIHNDGYAKFYRNRLIILVLFQGIMIFRETFFYFSFLLRSKNKYLDKVEKFC